MGSEKIKRAPVYNSFGRKLQLVPVSGINRPSVNRQTLFYNKNMCPGVAVHSGDILSKIQEQQQ